MSDFAHVENPPTLLLPAALSGPPEPRPAEHDPGVFSAVDLASRACLLAAFVLLLPITALTIAQIALGYHSYALKNADMEPALAAGSLLVSHPTAGTDLQVRDVIAFHPPGRPDELVTHRIVASRKGADGETVFVTRGDGLPAADAWLVPSAATVDRVVLSVPFAGYPAAALQTATGRLLFLVLPAAMLSLVLVNERARRSRARAWRRALVSGGA